MTPRGCRALTAALLIASALTAWVRLGPIDPVLLDQGRFASARIVDRNGEALYEPLSAAGTRRHAVGASDLPENVVRGTIAAEDRRFFSHPGVDPIAITRAAWNDLRRMRIVEGGSTLTQQTAKLLLESRGRSLGSKVRETVLALRLEHRFSKREILAMYLNAAPYGNRISGIGRASRSYFRVAPSELTAAQAAFLAGLPQRPSAYNPHRDARRALARQQYVLAKMGLSPGELAQAKSERLQFAPPGQPLIAQHFVERVLERSGARAGVIRTTLDAPLQREVAGIIAAQRKQLIAHGAGSVAVVVLDNRTGQWLAWEGSGDYFGERFGGAIDGVVTPRQPGSALKPFTYATAFESGSTPATVLADLPSHFPTAEEGVIYTPRNYDGRYRGPLRVREALAGSQNVPAVAMLARVTPASLLRVLRSAGFTTLERNADYYGLGLTLGDAEVRLDELVTAYAAFARGGRRVVPRMLPEGNAASDERPLFSQRTAFWISDILSDPDAREYAFGSGGSLDFPFRVAVKTGTSQAYRDNWTVGFTRDVTVGVWVGNFDRSELRHSSGVTGAAPVFNAVMLAATQRLRGTLPIGDDSPLVDPPDDVESLPICALSGLRPSRYCPAVRKESLPTEAPAEFCWWHHDGSVDWPAEYRQWARASLPSTPTAPRAARQPARLRVVNPPDGATFLIDPTLRSAYQKVRLRALSDAPVSWYVDARPLGAAEWALRPGRHTITATDARGQRDSVEVYVK